MSGVRRARVHHADLWGSRDEKSAWLSEHDWKHTSWRELHPRPGFYLFVPTDERALEEYNAFPKVTDIFPVYSVGIVTARDRLTIRFSPEEVWTTVLNFSRLDPELAREAYKLGKDARDWKVTLAQEDLRKSGPNRKHIVPILYRPFDVRYTYYTGRSRGFICMPRPEVMRHMLAGENIALITSRVTKGETFKHAQVTRNITEVICMSPKTSNNGFVFPLYLYPDISKKDLISELEPNAERRPNLNPKAVAALKAAYGEEPTPEEIFHYVYAILYAPTYREKYAEFLRIDFPRIPFTSDYELFKRMAELGKRLVDLHLLRSPELDPPIARLQGEGDRKVQTGNKGLRYDPEAQRVYINEGQYFEGVPPEVWEYQIGGYQVCSKWLKDRKGRKLILADIRSYCRIVTALSKTIEIQQDIGEFCPAVEESLVRMDSSNNEQSRN